VSGKPPARTAQEAEAQLGAAVGIYLDGGPRPAGLASTILDCSNEAPVILRAGAVSFERIQEVLGEIELTDQIVLDSPPSPTGEQPIE
jgi:tRNA A37 threonylcarbamoyladenosine synthetase subunit TsaC/SUA5/YrdC